MYVFFSAIISSYVFSALPFLSLQFPLKKLELSRVRLKFKLAHLTSKAAFAGSALIRFPQNGEAAELEYFAAASEAILYASNGSDCIPFPSRQFPPGACRPLPVACRLSRIQFSCMAVTTKLRQLSYRRSRTLPSIRASPRGADVASHARCFSSVVADGKSPIRRAPARTPIKIVPSGRSVRRR